MSAPRAVNAALLDALPLPEASAHADKEQRGRVLVVAGAAELPGAAVLAAIAALRAGAGKLQIATVESIATAIGVAVPEAFVARLPENAEGGISLAAAKMLLPHVERAGAVLLGPGMVGRADVAGLACAVLERHDNPPLVLDAAALVDLMDAAALVRSQTGCVVLTPHHGELAALLRIDIGKIRREPLQHARETARLLNAIVVLKGSDTFVATPDGDDYCFSDGDVGLATSGSGDVLAGIIAGLLARGAPPHTASVWGSFLHAAAGARLARRFGKIGYLARELLDEIAPAMAEAAG